MIFNKGTVSIDQYTEELIKAAELAGWSASQITDNIHNKKKEVAELYWAGADVDETLNDLKSESDDQE